LVITGNSGLLSKPLVQPVQVPLDFFLGFLLENSPMIRFWVRVVGLFILSQSASQAWAWGNTGHHTVGEIADQFLNPAARKAVLRILGTETLAGVATFPDEMRSNADFNFAAPWHYTEVPPGQTYDPGHAPHEGDVVVKIEEMKKIISGQIPEPTYQVLRTLPDGRTEPDPARKPVKFTKNIAMKYLVHLLGDLQQPLHVGNASDHGGNNCIVYYFEQANVFHVVWDSAIIDSMGQDYKTIATQLINKRETLFPGRSMEDLGKGSTFDWTAETIATRPSIYPIVNPNDSSELRQPYCITKFNYTEEQIRAADEIRRRTGRRKYSEILPELIAAGIVKAESIPHLGEAYRLQAVSIIERELLSGGARLAAVLNAAFVNEEGGPSGPPPTPSDNCEKSLQE
jgi:hypothetical protein